jgi:hypothetical protein
MTNPRDVLYMKMARRGGWAHLDLADALKVMEKEKTFHIATIKWLIVLIPVLIPDCLSNIYLLEIEIYSDHWMKKTLNKYWSINRNVFYFIVLQFYFYTIKFNINMQHRICKFEAKLLLNRFIYRIL